MAPGARTSLWTLVALILITAAILPAASASGAGHDSPRAHASKRGCHPATYSGHGTRKLGTLRIRRSVTLRWSTSGRMFQLSARRGFLLVNTQRRRGRVRIARGTYRRLTVATRGHWRITIRCS